MRTKRLAVRIAAIVLCLLIPFSVLGEGSARHVEENGKIIETVWEDGNGNPVNGPEGYYAVRYTYKAGNNIYEAYFDAEGNPCRSLSGCYGRRVMKDGNGNILEIEYLDENGGRMLNNRGYGMVNISYFGFGAERNIFYYGLGKKQIMVPSLGYASIVYEYSNKTMTARTFRDENGKPVDGADGYAVMKQKLNKRFQVISIRYDHADGSPAIGPDGWFRCVRDRDDNGRLLSVKYYDTNMQLIDRGAGYAWEGYEWEGDDTVKVTRYDLQDQPVADAAGVTATVREMKDGLVVKESFLDRDGKRANNSLGVGAVVYGYDGQGSLVKVTYQDTEGKPAVCRDGYAGYRDEKDGDGATVSRTFLGPEGTPAETAGGYSEIRYFYDDAKTLTSAKYYDLAGKQVRSE